MIEYETRTLLNMNRTLLNMNRTLLNMKRTLILFLIAIVGMLRLHADEGMWLLKLMEQQHLTDSLRKAGLQIPTDELYSETSPSLRDVIGIFGNGCTGELVSSEGLVLTNNHCGFSYVHEISTMDHNYLYEGFFAKSREEEVACPGLTFTFVIRIDDVTADVVKAAKKANADAFTMQSQDFLEGLTEKFLKKSGLAKEKNIRLRIVPYFGGNQFYAFYEQSYSDVRLVVNPPMQIGQYGFNQDNWLWPRHNCDFALFRIYADAEGKPAEYAATNIPLKCKKWLPVSLGGVSEGDYTMIMGFPGRTSRYLTRSQVEFRCESINEPINIAGEAELNFMKQQMDSDPALALKYADDYMSLGNMVKNFGGMNASVRSTGLLDIKAREEAAFRQFAAQAGKPEYTDIIDRIDRLVATYKDTLYDMNLFESSFGAQSLSMSSRSIQKFREALKDGKNLEQARKDFLDNYTERNAKVDRVYDEQKMNLLVPYWIRHHRLEAEPDFVKGKTAEEMKAYYASLYHASAFAQRKSLEAFIDTCTLQGFDADPLVKHLKEMRRFSAATYNHAEEAYAQQVAGLNKTYVLGLCEMYDWAKSPDANFTLRMTYGHVGGYSPRDAVSYNWKTTLKGMMEKENPKDPDYVIDEPLRKFFLAKDYGRYAGTDGELPTCFLTNNDITGGNSGSAVLNARGELIGLAFDGNIESLSGDLRFNPELQRCICVDIRYVLFICDLYGGSTYAVEEMTIRP